MDKLKMHTPSLADEHFAALAAAIACHLSHNLGHHLVHVPALGNDVAMPSVGTGDGIVVAQGRAYPHRGGLRAIIQVGQARHPTAPIDIEHGLLKTPNRDHPSEDGHHCFFW